LLHVVVGLALLVLGIFGIISWWSDFGLVLRGLIPFSLVILGLIATGAGLARERHDGSERESEEPE